MNKDCKESEGWLARCNAVQLAACGVDRCSRRRGSISTSAGSVGYATESSLPPPPLNWSIMVKTPAAHLPTTGGPMKVHAASPTCMADSRKNHAHLHRLVPQHPQAQCSTCGMSLAVCKLISHVVRLGCKQCSLLARDWTWETHRIVCQDTEAAAHSTLSGINVNIVSRIAESVEGSRAGAVLDGRLVEAAVPQQEGQRQPGHRDACAEQPVSQALVPHNEPAWSFEKIQLNITPAGFQRALEYWMVACQATPAEPADVAAGVAGPKHHPSNACG